MPEISCVPEAFFDTPVINGMAYPYVEVEPRRYRFLRAQWLPGALLSSAALLRVGVNPGEPDFSKPGPAFIQIASEGGVLPQPVVMNNPPVQIPTGCDGRSIPTARSTCCWRRPNAPT